MPRERKSAKNKQSNVNADHHLDGSEPPAVKAPKKRRGSAANSGANMRGNANQNQNGDSMMGPPPQPLGSGYGDTLYASNPFDDTPPMCPPGNQHPIGMPPQMGGPMSQHGPPNPMMNPNGPGGMMPGNARMMGGGGQRGMSPGNMGVGPKLPGMLNNGPPQPPVPPPPSMPGVRPYPPEQSMVFNTANPNAPPIYQCGFCRKEINDNDQAILCESGCNFWYHRNCVRMSDSAFLLLRQEVYAEWVCDNCYNSKNIPLIKFKS